MTEFRMLMPKKGTVVTWSHTELELAAYAGGTIHVVNDKVVELRLDGQVYWISAKNFAAFYREHVELTEKGC